MFSGKKETFRLRRIKGNKPFFAHRCILFKSELRTLAASIGLSTTR